MRTTISSADLVAILEKMATDMEAQKDYLLSRSEAADFPVATNTKLAVYWKSAS
jgi:hypothetical protein